MALNLRFIPGFVEVRIHVSIDALVTVTFPNMPAARRQSETSNVHSFIVIRVKNGGCETGSEPDGGQNWAFHD